MLTSKLLTYYQKELAYLKTKGAHFALRFPKIARRLGISETLSEDPHVERLIEAFALLCANVQQRLDEDMPEVTHALLTALAPQFLRQLPSVCIIQFKPDVQTAGITAKSLIDSGTELYSNPVEGHVCRFRTVFPVRLYPMTLERAQITRNESDMSWRLQMHFQVWSKAFIEGETLRFYLHGTTPMVNVLYTLLCSEVQSATIELEEQFIRLEPDCVTPVGFAQGETLLGSKDVVSPAHTLLQEYFWFQKKFHFIDIQLPKHFSAAGNESFTLEFLFSTCPSVISLESMAALIDANAFRLGCSPAINLFSQRAEPVVLNDSTLEYPVIPDVRYQPYLEVWAIDSVIAMRKQGNEMSMQPILPLFGIDHSRSDTSIDVCWQAMQRESKLDQGSASDWFIAFSDRFERLSTPACDMVRLNLTCTNRNVPLRLINGDPNGDFKSSLPLAGVKISALTRPTEPVRPLQEQVVRWRLISQLALNHQLLSGAEGTRVLKETLCLYSTNVANERLINMISKISVEPIIARLVSTDPRSLARGVEIRIMFTPEASQESEYFLLCQLLDHFLALYAPVNSFSQVVTLIDSLASSTRRWPIRAGRLLWL